MPLVGHGLSWHLRLIQRIEVSELTGEELLRKNVQGIVVAQAIERHGGAGDRWLLCAATLLTEHPRESAGRVVLCRASDRLVNTRLGRLNVVASLSNGTG